MKKKVIVVGRGRGGSLGLAKPRGKPTEESEKGVKKESDLYTPLKNYLDKYWGPDYEKNYFYSKITATPKGHRRKSGQWSRPDLAIITITSYQYLPNKVLEVTTIEVKRYADMSVEAVFEAASHSKFSHQAYLVVEWITNEDMDPADDEVKRIFTECQTFGIGLIQMKKENGSWSYRQIIDPKTKIPDPEACNQFIEQNFKEQHSQILGALGKR